MNNNLPEYTIETNHWTGTMQLWTPGEKPARPWTTKNEVEAIKKLAYFRLAYPKSTFSLHRDGYIVSGKELSEMAQHILLD